MNRFAQFHERHPWWIRGLIAALTLIACWGLSKLRFDSDPRVMFRSNNEPYQKLLSFYERFGEDDQDCVMLVEGASLCTPDGLRSLRSFVAELNNDEEVEAVVSIFSARKANRLVPLMLIDDEDWSSDSIGTLRQEMAEHPVIRGQLLSEDGRTTVVSLRLNGTELPIEKLEIALERFQQMADRHLQPAHMTCEFVGHPSVRIAVLKTLQREVGRFALLGAAISGIIAWIVFRNATMLLISWLGPSMGVAWTLGAMGWLGIAIDPLLVILPTLLFVVGFTDAFHLLNEMQGEIASGKANRAAAGSGVRLVGPACALTALTTAIGFASLSVASAECIQRFGLTCALGTAITFVANQLWVPTLVASRLGTRLRRISQRPRWGFAIWSRSGFEWLLRRHRATAGLGCLLVALCFLSSLRLQADLRWLETLPKNSSVVSATEKCDRLFGGAFTAYVIVKWPEGVRFPSEDVLELLQATQRVCGESLVFAHPFSLNDVLESIRPVDETRLEQIRHLKRMPSEILNRLLHRKERELVIVLHVPDTGARTLAPQFDGLRRRLAELEKTYPGARWELTGTVVVAANNVYQIIRDLSLSLSLASVVIFGVMVSVFRSLGLGLLTILPNILPQTLTALVLVVAGEPLTITSVLTFSLCLGLSVDDTVHFLMRFLKETTDKEGDYEALVRTYASAGNTMLTTSMVLIGGFAAMLISSMPGIRWFAILSCTTLVAALIGDLVLLPSLLLTFPLRRRR